MKTNDLIRYEADIFEVEKINGDGFALIHRVSTKGDLRVIRPEHFELVAGLWQEKPEVDIVKEEGRA